MTETRHTADTINDDALDQLYDGLDRLAATLREVLNAFARVTSPTSGGVMGYQAPPIHPDDMDRWRAIECAARRTR